jgi:hypothetical protein
MPEKPNVWKGLAAGVAGGLAASWAMNQFQALWNRLSGDEEKSERAHSPRQNGRREATDRGRSTSEEDAPATVRAADAVSETVLDRHLTKGEKRIAGPAVHYAFGTSVGATYGIITELLPQATAGAGTAFGATVWLVADETVIPLLGLSKGPTEYPLSKHAYSLASHFVYGATTEAVRRLVRNAL